MSRALLYSLGNCTICPNCSGRAIFVPDDTFYTRAVCVDCDKVYFCVKEGVTEREYVAYDNYSEALNELLKEDDLK